MCHVNTTRANWKKEKENRHRRRRFRQPACVYPTPLICFVEVYHWQIGKTNSVSQKLVCWSSFYCADDINIGRKTKVPRQSGVACVAPACFVPEGHRRLFTETESEAPHFISGFPISLFPFPFPLSPFPVHLSHGQSVPAAAYFKHSVAPRPHQEHSLEKGGKRALLCSPPDFADGLHHEIRGLCGHHAAELSQRAKITPGQEGKGRWLRRVEEEGIPLSQKRQHQCLPSSIYSFWGNTHRCYSFFFFLIHIIQFLVSCLSRSLPPSSFLCVGSKAATCVRE